MCVLLVYANGFVMDWLHCRMSGGVELAVTSDEIAARLKKVDDEVCWWLFLFLCLLNCEPIVST